METKKTLEENKEEVEKPSKLTSMEEILRKQEEVNVLLPAGSRRYKDWNSVPVSDRKWSIKRNI